MNNIASQRSYQLSGEYAARASGPHFAIVADDSPVFKKPMSCNTHPAIDRSTSNLRSLYRRIAKQNIAFLINGIVMCSIVWLIGWLPLNSMVCLVLGELGMLAGSMFVMGREFSNIEA